jgi:hypothetical protein
VGLSNKGPSAVDKRNKDEMVCEFCERIFKQVQRRQSLLEKTHIPSGARTLGQAHASSPTRSSIFGSSLHWGERHGRCRGFS